MEELLKLLEKSLYWEEDFIKNYDTEVTWEFLKAELSEDKFEKIKKLLEENISDTHKHHTIIKELIEKIRNGEHGA